jgi:tetraacyldisaccharide 4'-kinase
MGWIELHRRLARGEALGAEAALGAALVPASMLYGFGVGVRNWAYDWHLLPSRGLHPPWSVISVGGLAAGGAGKTPFAAALARRLRAAGLRPLIVSQGYGAPRRDRNARIISIGRMGRALAEGWETAGEEAILLARLAPEAAVAVAARYEDAARAVEGVELDPNVLVLDGGFQHRRLRQDVRMVVLDVSRDPTCARLLPRGDLREPWRALRRAHWIILHRTELCRDPAVWEQLLDRAAPGQPRIRCENRCGMPYALAAADPPQRFVWADLIGKRLGIWTALGNPEAFVAGLERLGVRPVWQRLARDHAPFGRRDADELVQAARERRVRAFLVTQKDAIKMETYIDHIPPVIVVPAEVVPVKGDEPLLGEFVRSFAQEHAGPASVGR